MSEREASKRLASSLRNAKSAATRREDPVVVEERRATCVRYRKREQHLLSVAADTDELRQEALKSLTPEQQAEFGLRKKTRDSSRPPTWFVPKACACGRLA